MHFCSRCRPALKLTSLTQNRVHLLSQGRTLQEMLPHVLSCSGPSASHPAVRLEGGSAITGVHVTGFVTPPHAALPSRAEQYTYVNRRFVHRCEPISRLVESLHSQLQHLNRTSPGPGAAPARGDPNTLNPETSKPKTLDHGEDPAPRGAGGRSFPAFVLFVECPPAMVDILAGADATQALSADWGPVLDATRAALLAAWKQYLPDRMLRAPRSTGAGGSIRDGGERGRWRSEPGRAAQTNGPAGAAAQGDAGAPRVRSDAAAQPGLRARAAAGHHTSAPQMVRLCSLETPASL